MGNTQTNEIFQQTMFDYWKVSNLVTPGSEMLTHTHIYILQPRQTEISQIDG